MHLVSVSDLTDIGMPPGDAIHLREYASQWWTEECQHVAKCPHDIEPVYDNFLTKLTPLSKQLCFEKCFNDGGRMTIYRPAVRSESWGDEDHTW